jgi:predicted DNA-binding transcriptional regulator YafY
MWKLAADRLDSLDEMPDATATDTVLPADAALAAIFEAIAETREVQFSYRGAVRRVMPRSLAFRTGHWYLSAFDAQRADERSFRVDRVDGEVVLGERSQVPPLTRVQGRSHPWEIGEAPVAEALVRITADQAPWAVRHLGEHSVRERNHDGAVTVALQVRNQDAFRSFVLGFLDGATVLSPEPLRALVIDWLQSMITDPLQNRADGTCADSKRA